MIVAGDNGSRIIRPPGEGLLLTNVNKLVGWFQANSVWPLSFRACMLRI